MQFMTRSLVALGILTLTLALLALAGFQIISAMQERDARGSRQRPAEERVYAVNVDTLRLGTAAPVITAYGEAKSWRELELRTAASGVLVEISDQFRDGGFVPEGALLYRIDPADATADRELAETQVKEAEAELLEARAARDLALGELAAAQEQKSLRQAALTRQEGLKTRGVGTDSSVETARLSLSSSRQTELARQQAAEQAKARILRAEIGLQRQKIALDEARRRLDETVARAPFDGIFANVTAVVGRQVGTNELMGTLIDPAAVEVAFRVSTAQFARLVDGRGLVQPVPITATLDLAGAAIPVVGRVDRAGAEVGEGQTGRVIYARLDAEGGRALRPGDFLRVDIREPELTGVAEIPAAAARSDGTMLLLDGPDRLAPHKATILRRQADTLIVADIPEGREYVQRIQPQLGPGVKVKPIRPGAEIEAVKMITLDDDRRQKLIAAVEGNQRMPAQAKKRVIDRLSQDQVPEETVARIEARMAGGQGGGQSGGRRGNRDGDKGGDGGNDRGGDRGARANASGGSDGGGAEMVQLDQARRDRLLAFVTANSRMPEEAKTRILAQLKQPDVPASLVARLESRMGG